MWNSYAHVWTAGATQIPTVHRVVQTNGRADGLAGKHRTAAPRHATPANNPHSQSVGKAVSHRCYAQLQRPDHTLFFQPQTAPFSRCSPRWARQVYASIRPSKPPAYIQYALFSTVGGRTDSRAGRPQLKGPCQTYEQRINETRQLDTSSTSRASRLPGCPTSKTTTMWIIGCRVVAPSIPRAPSSLR